MPDFTESFTSFFSRKKTTGIKPILLNPVRFPFGQFQFQIKLPKGANYEVQSTQDLKTWNTIKSGKAEKEVVDFAHPDASEHSYQYYRVLNEGLPSPSVIGYVTINFEPGFRMIANPLNGADNTVGKLFANLPNGVTLHKFDIVLFKLSENSIDNGKWQKPGDTLIPGEGGLLQNPSSDWKPITFVGEVMQGNLTLPIPAGFSIRSSMVPVKGKLQTDLLFPIADGDAIHLYNTSQQQYDIYNFQGGKWDPAEPEISPGESFWVGKTVSANWVRNVSIE